ncbi:MFS transporter [Patulibacter minatonensis]|uniref:MFS transporter n=1 Tax=Patulibacter minatonensis TaxID=298163 RepID=UPI00047C3270|nr:MFS transporter [Patulibacter minatonensis]
MSTAPPTDVADPATAAPPDPRRWRALAVLALAQFMVVLDVTIANVALPAIQTDLGFSPIDLQWVVGAYTLTFGGLLLLGGRVADLLGRRRMLSVGLGLFAIASLAAGFAPSSGALIAARALQGVGGALLSPAALSIVTVTFAPGRERGIALGVWGALAGLGGTAGVVAGGLLIDSLGWEWVFFVNVPIALIALVAIPLTIRESRADTTTRSFDVAGAVLGTAGVSALVLGVIRSDVLGWGAFEVLALLGGGALMLALFALVETRAAAPLVPPRLARSRPLALSGLALALNGSAFIGMFYLSAIFLQGVRGASAIETGLQFVPMGVTAVAGAIVAQNLVGRIGARTTIAIGALLGGGSLLLLSTATAGGSYATDLLPGFLLYGASISLIGVPAQIGAVTDVTDQDAGSASGLLSAAYQVGSALGLAIITTIATGHVDDLIGRGVAASAAQTAGFERGLQLAAGLAVLNVVIAFALAGRRRTADATPRVVAPMAH